MAVLLELEAPGILGGYQIRWSLQVSEQVLWRRYVMFRAFLHCPTLSKLVQDVHYVIHRKLSQEHESYRDGLVALISGRVQKLSIGPIKRYPRPLPHDVYPAAPRQPIRFLHQRGVAFLADCPNPACSVSTDAKHPRHVSRARHRGTPH